MNYYIFYKPNKNTELIQFGVGCSDDVDVQSSQKSNTKKITSLNVIRA